MGGRGARRRDGADWTCLVRVYLLCCCGACSRRSLRCHIGAFIHLERFEGLSCARKSSRRLRRFALDLTSKERPCSACPGRLSPCTGFCIARLCVLFAAQICVLMPCLLRVLRKLCARKFWCAGLPSARHQRSGIRSPFCPSISNHRSPNPRCHSISKHRSPHTRCPSISKHSDHQTPAGVCISNHRSPNPRSPNSRCHSKHPLVFGSPISTHPLSTPSPNFDTFRHFSSVKLLCPHRFSSIFHLLPPL